MLVGLELLRAANDGLRSHRLRSGLTALGVIFGVAAVIGMASIGEGAKREALRQIELLGASNIIIDEDRPDEGESRFEALDKNPTGLTRLDANSLQELLPNQVKVTPMRIEEREITVGRIVAKLNVVATTEDHFELYHLNAVKGRTLSFLDEEGFAKVCVLGWGAKRELFPLDDPIGKRVKIDDQLYSVVGVVDKQLTGKGNIEGLDLRNQNKDIYLPLSSWLKRNPPGNSESELTRIVVQVKSTDYLSNIAGLCKRILQRRHRQVVDFKVIIPEQLLRQHRETQRIFNIVMGTIASISLLVGGIGIMNIMLASVLERTREIGIRRAVGAKRADIARQFLAEAVLLSVSGGVIGVIVGFVLAYVITLYAGWETVVSVWAVLIAFGVSVSVGIIFGWLPARRAAMLDPIAALRAE